MQHVLLDENISIKKVEDFHNNLIELLKKDNTLVLDFNNVKRLDLSVIQVLIAVSKYGKKNKKDIKMRHVSEKLRRQFYLSGFVNSKIRSNV